MLLIMNDKDEAENKEETKLEVVELKTPEVMGETEIAFRTILRFTSKGMIN